MAMSLLRIFSDLFVRSEKKPDKDVNTNSRFAALPNEIIEKSLLIYLSSTDIQSLVKSFGITGNHRFKAIADRVLKTRSKSKSHEIINLYTSHLR